MRHLYYKTLLSIRTAVLLSGVALGAADAAWSQPHPRSPRQEVPPAPKSSLCVERAAHSSVGVFVVDPGTAQLDRTTYLRSLRQVRDLVIPGERVVVAFMVPGGGLDIIMDLVLPEKKSYKSAKTVESERDQFLECITHVGKAGLQRDARIASSLGFDGYLVAVRKILFEDGAPRKRAYFFLTLPSVDKMGKEKGNVFEQKKPVGFDDVHLYIGGLGNQYTPQEFLRTQEFWSHYFESTGATVQSFGTVTGQK
jgi:hypothetical protein